MCQRHQCRPSWRPTQATRILSVDRLLLASALGLLVPALVDAQPTTTRMSVWGGGGEANRSGIGMAIARVQQPVATQSGLASLRPEVGIGGVVGVPLWEFGDNLWESGDNDDKGRGFAVELTFGLGDGPIRIGGGGGCSWYASETRRVPRSETIPDVLVDVTTDSGITTLYALLRAQPGAGRLRPYVDGLVGFNYLFTATSVYSLDEVDEWGDPERIARRTNSRDFALSLGAGGGVMVELVRWPNDTRLNLDVGARYVFGGKADYLIPRSLGPRGEVAELEANRSRTDVVTIHVGLTYGF